MRFELQGVHDGRPVSLVWEDGALSGSPEAVAAVEQLVAAGEDVPVTPTGPFWPADLVNPARAYMTMLSVLDPAQGVTTSGELPDIPVYELPDGAVG